MNQDSYADYKEFFSKAMGGKVPYNYQIKFAESDTLFNFVNIPTGMGKTASIIIGWVWRRFYHPNKDTRENTPRRLVYCLPMRTLVEQTWRNAIKWLDAIDMLSGKVVYDDKGFISNYTPLFEKNKISVVRLMGGEEKHQWDIYPERNLILIGTQDFLLSATLNRGYGAGRFRWPIQFGLLNNDSLWAMDEIQLMGPGLTTSIQLHAFREIFGTVKNCNSIWISATFEKKWIETVDLKDQIKENEILTLTQEDLDNNDVQRIIKGNKILKKSQNSISDLKALAEEILNEHKSGTKTIVIVNTIMNARSIYGEIKKQIGKDKLKVTSILLLHSQFRSEDRERIMNNALAEPVDGGTILVATQIVEAGVDISCKKLFTEIAPWSSMVQRFGRCNRYGENDESVVRWIQTTCKGKKIVAEPYEESELKPSIEHLEELEGKNISFYEIKDYKMDLKSENVIRKKDLVELFDTRPYISNLDTDISRYIRNSNDYTISIFWRVWDLKGNDNLKNQRQPYREELCSAPKKDIQDIINKKIYPIYRWNSLDGKWEKIGTRDLFLVNGQVLMANVEMGCYSCEQGWDKKSKVVVEKIRKDQNNDTESEDAKGFDDDPTSQSAWKTISEHSDDVVNKCIEMIDEIIIPTVQEKLKFSICEAARWHDAGKAHYLFQRKIDRNDIPENLKLEKLAKAPSNKWLRTSNGFRHEFASALMAMNARVSDLSVYLVLGHHGKVRLSIRSGERKIVQGVDKKLKIMGLDDYELIDEVYLGGGITSLKFNLRLGLIELGTKVNGDNSWLNRSWHLLQEYGPFKIAYMESILRSGDQRASGGLE